MAETISTISLPPPEQWPHKGEPTIPWDRWKSWFVTYMLAIGLDVVSPKRKTAISLHCLGAEGLRLFQTLREAHTYDAAVERLDGHFAKKQSALLKRLHFRQRAGESVTQYIADLKELAQSCQFGYLRD